MLYSPISDYKPVEISKDGLRRFIRACRLAMPDNLKQEDVAEWIGVSRSTFAALLDISRIPKTESIPLGSYVNMLRYLRPKYPGTEIEIKEEDLFNLLIKEKDVSQVIYSALAEAVQSQLERNQKREGGRTYEECFDEFCRRLEGLPRNGLNYKDGSVSEEEARDRMKKILSGEYLPESEIEVAILAASLEREDGTHDYLWVKYLCGLMPATYRPSKV